MQGLVAGDAIGVSAAAFAFVLVDVACEANQQGFDRVVIRVFLVEVLKRAGAKFVDGFQRLNKVVVRTPGALHEVGGLFDQRNQLVDACAAGEHFAAPW